MGQKTESKIHQGERRSLGEEVWAPRGPEQCRYPGWHRAAAALPSPRVPLSALQDALGQEEDRK